MRRMLSCVLMMTLLLTGCKAAGPGGEERAENLAAQVRTEYLAMTGWSATVALTAEYGEKVFDFVMDVQWQREGETVLAVTAPELIAGITARVAKGEKVLEYDGAGISLGLLNGDGMTPVSAVPTLMDAILTGYMAESSFVGEGEGRQMKIVCRDPNLSPQEGTEYTLYFDPAALTLHGAEVSVAGNTVLTMEFSNFTAEMSQDGTGDGTDLG